jgi:hypothetical protein
VYDQVRHLRRWRVFGLVRRAERGVCLPEPGLVLLGLRHEHVKEVVCGKDLAGLGHGRLAIRQWRPGARDACVGLPLLGQHAVEEREHLAVRILVIVTPCVLQRSALDQSFANLWISSWLEKRFLQFFDALARVCSSSSAVSRWEQRAVGHDQTMKGRHAGGWQGFKRGALAASERRTDAQLQELWRPDMPELNADAEYLSFFEIVSRRNPLPTAEEVAQFLMLEEERRDDPAYSMPSQGCS